MPILKKRIGSEPTRYQTQQENQYDDYMFEPYYTQTTTNGYQEERGRYDEQTGEYIPPRSNYNRSAPIRRM